MPQLADAIPRPRGDESGCWGGSLRISTWPFCSLFFSPVKCGMVGWACHIKAPKWSYGKHINILLTCYWTSFMSVISVGDLRVETAWTWNPWALPEAWDPTQPTSFSLVHLSQRTTGWWRNKRQKTMTEPWVGCVRTWVIVINVEFATKHFNLTIPATFSPASRRQSNCSHLVHFGRPWDMTPLPAEN